MRLLFVMLWLVLTGPAFACTGGDEFCGRPQPCHRTGGVCHCDESSCTVVLTACGCGMEPAEAPVLPAAEPREVVALLVTAVVFTPVSTPALWPDVPARGRLRTDAPEPPPPRS